MQIEIESIFAGMRLDKVLATLLPDYSRTSLQQWINQGLVLVDGKLETQKFCLRGGEKLRISPPQPTVLQSPAQKIDFEVVDSDEHILVINKPHGLVVHPGAGCPDQTLLNGLLYFDESLSALPRAGIVHRLDKNTTGLMIIARNEATRQRLISIISTRQLKRQYLAVVNGVMVSGEYIEQPIGRHRHDRRRMCVTDSGKFAATQIRVERKFRCHCLVRAELKTGRTHQIRVHLSWRGFALVGDKAYNGRVLLPPAADQRVIETLQTFNRQALHSSLLSLRHPITGETKQWQQPLPADMQYLIEQLDADCRSQVDSSDNYPFA